MIELPKHKFLRFQQVFYEQVIALPVKVKMLRRIVDDSADEYEKFTKSASSTPEEKEIRCLYRTNITEAQRTRFGISKEITAVIYIPPKELVDTYGDFKQPYMSFQVQHEDLNDNEIYVVKKVKYAEPLYDTCIHVELHLKTEKKE